MRQLVFDTETYANFFLAMFKDINDGSTFTFEAYEGQLLNVRGLEQILAENEIISFNGNTFDLPDPQNHLTFRKTKPRSSRRT